MKDLINKDIILYLIIGLAILIYGSTLVFPKFQKTFTTIDQIKKTKVQIEQYEMQKAQKAQQNTEQKESLSALPVKVFKSPYPDVSVENASVSLVENIVSMLQETGNSITQISYSTDSVDEATRSKLPANYHVLSLKLTMNSSYLSLQNFFKKIFTWEYLGGIRALSISAQPGNQRKLNTSFELWLFVEK